MLDYSRRRTKKIPDTCIYNLLKRSSRWFGQRLFAVTRCVCLCATFGGWLDSHGIVLPVRLHRVTTEEYVPIQWGSSFALAHRDHSNEDDGAPGDDRHSDNKSDETRKTIDWHVTRNCLPVTLCAMNVTIRWRWNKPNGDWDRSWQLSSDTHAFQLEGSGSNP